jgi:putative tricarboxylic transport membrane protein
MHGDHGAMMRHGRIGAAALFVFALVFGWMGSRIEYAFSSDPLGPRVFPIALAIVLAGLAILNFIRPGRNEAWPRGATLTGAIALPTLVAAAALLLGPAGFFVAIFVMTAGASRVFGASWAKALLAGVLHAAGWYLLFAVLLEVQLPSGDLFKMFAKR